MKNEDDISKNGKEVDGELLDFEFDELSEEKDVEKAGEDSLLDNEILELVDVVEPGAEAEDLKSVDIEQSDLASNGLLQTPEEDEFETLESDLDSALKGMELSEDTDEDFNFLDSDVETMPESEQQPEIEEAVISSAVEEPVDVSDERIEAIVTKVVQDVVEKVARETMTTVAEKLITEAIDTLRESLKSSSD